MKVSNILPKRVANNQSCPAVEERESQTVADMRVGECACFAVCKDEALALLLSERGLLAGTKLRLCWRSSLGDALCIEVLSSRFSVRREEAKAMLLSL